MIASSPTTSCRPTSPAPTSSCSPTARSSSPGVLFTALAFGTAAAVERRRRLSRAGAHGRRPDRASRRAGPLHAALVELLARPGRRWPRWGSRSRAAAAGPYCLGADRAGLHLRRCYERRAAALGQRGGAQDPAPQRRPRGLAPARAPAPRPRRLGADPSRRSSARTEAALALLDALGAARDLLRARPGRPRAPRARRRDRRSRPRDRLPRRYAHLPVHSQTPEQFAADLRAAREAIVARLRQAAGRLPRARLLDHRARPPTGPTRCSHEEGFAYDSSQHDSPRIRGRVVDARAWPPRRSSCPTSGACGSSRSPSGGRRGDAPVPVGGASYWSVLPRALVLRGLGRGSRPAAGLYLHPHELGRRTRSSSRLPAGSCATPARPGCAAHVPARERPPPGARDARGDSRALRADSIRGALCNPRRARPRGCATTSAITPAGFDDLYEDERPLVRLLRPGLFRRRELAAETVAARRSPRVLDVGCGSGRIGEFVLDAGAARVPRDRLLRADGRARPRAPAPLRRRRPR